jgi:L,D-transpeptidase YcbB
MRAPRGRLCRSSVVVLVAMLLGTMINAGAGDNRPSPGLENDLANGIVAITARSAGERERLRALYAAREFAPLWFTKNGNTRMVRIALGELAAASAHGLSPADYDVSALHASVAAIDAGDQSTALVARTELELSAAVLRYLGDLHEGRVTPAAGGFRYAPHPNAFDVASLLLSAVAAGDLATAVTGAQPSFPIYRRLRALLLRYRSLAQSDDPEVFAVANKLAVGGLYPDAARLRRRLHLLGDLVSDLSPSEERRYDSLLADAVRRFQARHGLAPDGALGKDTVVELQKPLASRVLQIELAMERLRWLPDITAKSIIAINIPSYRLWAFTDANRNGAPSVAMRIVVGRDAAARRTPVFIGAMRYLELNPYWNVPRSIALQEILPRIGRDPGYLQREDMELLGGSAVSGSTVDTTTLNGLRDGTLRVRQRPGPKNPLGRIKFVLPNTMDIYLHGTSAPELFARTRRDFSHGCIRVDDPLALAAFVLRDQPTWTRERLEAAIAQGANSHIVLSEPAAVVIFYTTAISTSEGDAMFLPDVYGYDRKLIGALRAAGRHVE